MPESENEQQKHWNGLAGQAWVDTQELLDRIYEPFEPLLTAATHKERRHVLDVGCGTGSTTLALARAVGENGRCTGVDISEPMIAAARSRAEREQAAIDFICADAQTFPFEPAGVDLIVSRFGVMFFQDPVEAFSNLRRATVDDGELRVIVWRSAADNPFMTVAEHAAAPILTNLPPRRPGAPGQFAFANPERVREILEASGWRDVAISATDVACTLPESELTRYFTRLGPVGLVLHEADEETRARVIPAVREAFGPYVHGAEVRFTAACWTVDARAAARR